jgi:hypothetical protein
MDRYAFLADLVVTASDCVGNAANGCQYEVFVSPGEPPSDCSHIAAYWTGSSVMSGSDKCLIKVRENFSISLNRCCLRNIGEVFDAGLEDDDARCFIKDFEALFECLICEVNTVLKPYVRSCQDVVVSVGQPHNTTSGGCYGGVINISFTRHHPCCPPPSQPVPEFVFVYNDGDDTATLTSTTPVLGAVTQINYDGTNGSGAIVAGSHFVVDNPTQITITASAALWFNSPTTITQLNMFNGVTLVGTWNGSVVIP